MIYPALSLPGEGFVLKHPPMAGLGKGNPPWQLMRRFVGYVAGRFFLPSAQDAACRFVKAAAGSS
jgi:hypothetical protein